MAKLRADFDQGVSKRHVTTNDPRPPSLPSHPECRVIEPEALAQ
jgi:hypothetical protein